MDTSKKHRDFTVVIGSGGIKPIAAIPFFLFLEEYKLTPKMILACSGGSYVSCFWANGARNEQTLTEKINNFIYRVKNEKLFGTIDYRTLLGIPRYPFGRFNKKHGVLFGDKLLNMFKEMSEGRQLEDLPVKVILQATELETGNPVYLEKGDMASAIYASSALYPLLPPIEIGGKLLVDGAYHAELPLLEAVRRSDDIIIALSFEQPRSTTHNGFLNFFTTFITQVVHNHSHAQNSFALNLHQNEIIFNRYFFKRNIKIWDTDALPYIMDVGRKVMEERKQEILDLLFQD